MKIMTFNIQHCLDYTNRVIDFDLFADFIKKHTPDVCGLNEVRGEGPEKDYTNQTDILGDRTGYNRYFGEAIKVKKNSPYGNAILSRNAIKSAETIKIPDPVIKLEPASYETRCVIKAVINIEDKDICFLVTHMGLAKKERKNAVKTICTIIDATDLPVILMGDFNAEPDDPVFDPIKERLSDTQDKSDNHDVKTYPSDKPRIKIDYIFYRGLECINAHTITEVCSDHLPIIAQFR